MPDITVQVMMPAVIIITERYFKKSYCFFSIKIPITMLAISDPCVCVKKTVLKSETIELMAWTDRTEYHVQRHRDVKVEGIVVAHVNEKKHRDQRVVRTEWDPNIGSATFCSNQESFDSDKQEL